MLHFFTRYAFNVLYTLLDKRNCFICVIFHCSGGIIRISIRETHCDRGAREKNFTRED